MDWKTLLAPFAGAGAAWLASHGLALSADQQAAAITIVSGGLTAIAHWWHTRPAAAGTPTSKQGGFSRLSLLAVVSALAIGAAVAIPACKTLPSGTAQAGIAAAVDIATGLAVQQGTSNPAIWKARAAQFEQAAKALQAINAAGPTSLQTLLADLQPYIVKLGPADVLAANALVAALTPILQAQLGTNPTLANTQAEIALILGDVVAACAAYTGA